MGFIKFSTEIAEEYGVNEAILLDSFYTEENRGVMFSREDLHSRIVLFSIGVINRTLHKLLKHQLISANLRISEKTGRTITMFSLSTKGFKVSRATEES